MSSNEFLLRCSGRSCLEVAGVPWRAFRGLDRGDLATLSNAMQGAGWTVRPVTVTSSPVLLIGESSSPGKSIAVLCPRCSRMTDHARGLLNI